MPRERPFTIHLSRKERETLEGRARKYTLPYCQVLRGKMQRKARLLHFQEYYERMATPFSRTASRQPCVGIRSGIGAARRGASLLDCTRLPG